MQEIGFVLLGLLLGGLIVWIITQNKGKQIREAMNSTHVSRAIYDEVKTKLDVKEKELIEVHSKLAGVEQNNIHLEKALLNQETELKKTQETLQAQFENLANKLLEEKSKKFLKLNEETIGNILTPLKDKIKDFEKKVDDTHKEEIRERASLKKELEQIISLNQQVSEDANRLTNALKGDSTVQGNWGETQLELILETAGLEKDIHYRKQENLKSDETGETLRPDYIINLPENKNLVLDSKVSITDYERYFNSDDENERAGHLKKHLLSVNKHVSGLGAKNYQTLYGINPPDYVLMFVPVEPALMLAIKEDAKLFEKAMGKNVVLVSVSTLLATLRTISYIWKQENQRRNVYEIARESGKLYDKFVGFTEDLIGVGKKLDSAKDSFSDAMNKLVTSTKKGDTIVGRMERIKGLGADTTKSIPQSITDQIRDDILPENDV